MSGDGDARVDGIEIRPLRTHAEFLACVELQRATWGRDFAEVVPPAILKVSQRVGGVCAGAFDPHGRLLGFVFGITGVEGGRLVHWSDMLAVRSDMRDAGLGQRLKEYQRATVRANGVERMYWTYDPLVARNAHLNFNRLGVRAVEYVEDMYGDMASDLTRGLGSDRFIVAWPLDTRPAPLAPDGTPASVPAALRDAPVLDAGAGAGAHPGFAIFAAAPPPALRVEIPLDIASVQASSLTMAAHWRAVTRESFQWALGRRYEVLGFYRDEGAGYYVLARQGQFR